MLPLVNLPCSSERPHIQEYMSTTNWTWWEERGKSWFAWEDGTDLGGIIRGGECINKTHCMKFLEN